MKEVDDREKQWNMKLLRKRRDIRKKKKKEWH